MPSIDFDRLRDLLTNSEDARIRFLESAEYSPSNLLDQVQLRPGPIVTAVQGGDGRSSYNATSASAGSSSYSGGAGGNLSPGVTCGVGIGSSYPVIYSVDHTGLLRQDRVGSWAHIDFNDALRDGFRALTETAPDRNEEVAPSTESYYNEASEIATEVMPMTYRFGVEIECFIRSGTRYEITEKLRQAGLSLHWKMKSDGSLRGARPGFEAIEIVSDIFHPNDTYWNSIRKLCEILDANGVHVNKTCGLHVHVDMNGFLPAEVKSVFERYQKFEADIDKFMPASRRANENTYCRTLRGVVLSGTTVQEMARPHSTEGRYKKLNLGAYIKYGTIEFRQHSGTTNAQKIINWVKFCLQFVKTSKELAAQRVREEVVYDEVEVSSLAPTSVAHYVEIFNQLEGRIAYVRSDTVTRTIGYRARDFIRALKDHGERLGLYTATANRALKTMPTSVRVSYITMKKYLEMASTVYNTQRDAFKEAMVRAGVSNAMVMAVMREIPYLSIGPSTRMNVIRVHADKLIKALRQYEGYDCTYEIRMNRLVDRLRGGARFERLRGAASAETISTLRARTVQTVVPVRNDEGLFMGIEADVETFYRERAGDFGFDL